MHVFFFFLWKISHASINRQGETTLEYGTQSRKSIAFCKFIEILQANQMFTKSFLHFLTKHKNNSNNK